MSGTSFERVFLYFGSGREFDVILTIFHIVVDFFIEGRGFSLILEFST